MTRLCLAVVLSLLAVTSSSRADAPTEAKKSPRPRRVYQSPLDEKLDGPSTDAAIEALEAAIQAAPDDKSLPSKRSRVVARLNYEKRFQEALPHAERGFEFELSYDGDPQSTSNLFNAAYVLAQTLEGLDQQQKALEVLEKARDVIITRFKDSSNVNAWGSYSRIKIQSENAIAIRLVKLGREDEALQLMADEEATWRTKSAKKDHNSRPAPTWRHAMLARIEVADLASRTDLVQALTATLDQEVLATLERNPSDCTNLIEFMEVRMATLDRTFRQDPEGARALLDATLPIIEEYKEADPEDRNVVQVWIERFGTYGPRIENARNAKRLIGQPAPPLEAAAWVNGDPRPLDSLRGKVVVLDFWAIWCAPCVASFPDLKALHKEFHSEGLEIVGVTRPYNFSWDMESDSPVGGEEPVEVDVEKDAVERFMKKHDLPFSGLLAPKPDHLFSDYGVSGIPHIVVIDRKGVVRLMKVGHSRESATAVRVMIQRLLKEE